MENLSLESRYSKILLQNGILEEIEKVEIFEPSNLAGEHFVSRCEYITVQFKNGAREPCHFFVKFPMDSPDNEIREMFLGIMLKESVFFTRFAPDMDQFYKEKLGQDNTFFVDLFPKAYYGEKDALILENICKRGYSMPDKSIRQDINQAKLVLKNLAKLHAVSHVLIQNSGSKDAFLKKYPTIFDRWLLTEADGILSQLVEPPFKRIFKMIHESGVEGGKEAAKKLEVYNGNILKTYRDTLNSPSLLLCVNHGDCWNNNMMFSENGDNVIFLDLQRHRVASPSVDIAYYLYTSTQPEVLCQWKELLKFYYEEFKSTSFEISNPISFSYDDLMKDYAVKVDLGFLFGLFFVIGTEAMNTLNVDANGYSRDRFDDMLVEYTQANKEKVAGFVNKMIDLLHIFEEVKTFA